MPLTFDNYQLIYSQNIKPNNNYYCVRITSDTINCY